MIFSAFERMVAMRYLRARRQEGFVSVITGFSLAGIALGVGTLIVVMSVMNGFRAELLDRILGFNSHLTVQAIDGPMPDFDAITGKLREIPGVASATPIVKGQVFVSSHGGGAGAIVKGIRIEDLEARTLIATHIVNGALPDFAGEDAAIMGARLADNLGLRLGSEFQVISPQFTTTIGGAMPRIKTYRLVATFDVGMYQYDNGIIFVPLEAAQIFFRSKGAATEIEVMAKDSTKVQALKTVVEQTFPPPRFQIGDWEQANLDFFTAVEVERNVMFLILTLIIIVAAFNIISGQIMMVKDKGRNIAIMRTMGATRGMILRIFLLSGASIGIVGTTIGCAIGIAFAVNVDRIRHLIQDVFGVDPFNPVIYFLSKLPAIVDPWEVVMISAMSLTLSLLASYYPAWRAARLDPVEALRYE